MDEAAPQASDAIAGWIRSQWEKGDNGLARERRGYWLNLAFYEGEQWVNWHRLRREVIEYRGVKGEEDRARVTANRIQPNIITLLARLSKQNLVFEVQAGSSDDGSLAGARLGEHVLESTRHDDGWESVRVDNLLNCFFGGTAAIVWEWDPKAGEEFAYDPETGEVIHTGNVSLSSLAITEFTLEPGTRDWRDARWFIMAKALPPKQVQDHYGLATLPKSDTSAAAGPLQRKLLTDRGQPANVAMTTVFSFYQRPSGQEPGRRVVCVGDEVILDEPWPFPHDHLNIALFRQQQIPKRWQGHTLLDDARPLQVAYNHGLSVVQEHMKRAGNARLAVPDNSGLDPDSFTDNAGEVLTYDGMSSTPPKWLDPPNLPAWLIQHIAAMKAELDDLMGVHDISRGTAPGDRNSGLALSVLAEKDETPMGLMAHDQSNGWSLIGSSCLEMWAKNVVEHRQATVKTDSGVPMSREWTGAQLRGQTSARVPLDAVMPHSRVATQAWILSLGQQFPQMMPQNASAMARMLDLPMTQEFSNLIDADVAQAERENHLMSSGQIPSMGATPYPVKWDDHAKHIAEHNRFRKSTAYMYATPDVRQIVDLHIDAHTMLALDQRNDQMALEQASPGASSVPQGHEPIGSEVPPDYVERQQGHQLAVAGAGAPPANQNGGPNAGMAAANAGS